MNKKSVQLQRMQLWRMGVVVIALLFIGILGGISVKKTKIAQDTSSPESRIMHRSLFMQKEFYEKGYSQSTTSGEMPQGRVSPRGVYKKVYGGIVNHHLLSLRTIADVTSQFRTDESVTLVLLSPDHFSAGRGLISTTLGDWDTPYGILQADSTTIKLLSRAGFVTVDPLPFNHEHGISGIIPFIKREMPNARVIPVIFKDRVSREQARKFGEELASLLPPQSRIIASLDFSHNVYSDVADTQDEVSKKIIQEFDYARIKEVAVDSQSALTALLQIMDIYGARRFELFENTNSAQLTKQDIPNATSYITGVFVAP